MADAYQNWRDRLAGKDIAIVEDRPDPGRYKMRRHRDAPWLPVAIGFAGSTLVALVDGVAEDPLKVWTWCAKHPVSKDAYDARMKNGHWPDEPKPVVLSNMPADPFEALKVEITDKLAQANALLVKDVRTQIDCDLLRNIQAQLLALNKSADEMFEKEKEPHLKAGRAVDEKYRFRTAVAGISARLREKYGAWMKAEEKRQEAEARRKFEEEQARVAAERERIQAERAKLMADEPVLALTDPEPEMPEMPVAPEPVRVQSGGGFGRKAGLRTEWVPVIKDQNAALGYFASHPDVVALVEKLVKKAVKETKGTVKIPGVEIVPDRKAA